MGTINSNEQETIETHRRFSVKDEPRKKKTQNEIRFNEISPNVIAIYLKGIRLRSKFHKLHLGKQRIYFSTDTSKPPSSLLSWPLLNQTYQTQYITCPVVKHTLPKPRKNFQEWNVNSPVVGTKFEMTNSLG